VRAELSDAIRKYLPRLSLSHFTFIVSFLRLLRSRPVLSWSCCHVMFRGTSVAYLIAYTSGVDIQGAWGVYAPPVRKIRNVLYLISELFTSVRKTCSCIHCGQLIIKTISKLGATRCEKAKMYQI